MAHGEPTGLRDVRFEVAKPHLLVRDEWDEIIDNELHAFQAAYPDRTETEVRHAIGADDIDSYVAARRDPMVDVERGRLRTGQMFSHPLIVIARSKGQVVGSLYSANATSGANQEIREAKMNARVPLKKWAWQREIAVAPEHWGRRIGPVMGYISLNERSLWQPVSAWTFREINRKDQRGRTSRFLEEAGLVRVINDTEKVQQFGNDAEQQVALDHYQLRWAGVMRILRKLRHTPGVAELIRDTLPDVTHRINVT